MELNNEFTQYVTDVLETKTDFKQWLSERHDQFCAELFGSYPFQFFINVEISKGVMNTAVSYGEDRMVIYYYGPDGNARKTIMKPSWLMRLDTNLASEFVIGPITGLEILQTLENDPSNQPEDYGWLDLVEQE